MKEENQLTSLEPSKKLEKLGVKQESLYMWVKYEMWSKAKVWTSDIEKEFEVTCLSGSREFAYPAFTVAELGEMLPWNYCSGKCSPSCKKGDYWCEPWSNSDIEIIYTDTEADARAKMLIYLLENKLITL